MHVASAVTLVPKLLHPTLDDGFDIRFNIRLYIRFNISLNISINMGPHSPSRAAPPTIALSYPLPHTQPDSVVSTLSIIPPQIRIDTFFSTTTTVSSEILTSDRAVLLVYPPAADSFDSLAPSLPHTVPSLLPARCAS
jgi:hypothetical protein